MGVFTGPSHGNVKNNGESLECLFACQFSECFSNFSPHHSDAFVSLLPGNRAWSGSAQCPGTSLAESLPNWGEARLLLPSGSSAPLSSRAELGGPLSLLGFEASRHLPWECSRPEPQAWGRWLWGWGGVGEANDLYLPCCNHRSLKLITCVSTSLAGSNKCGR